MSTLASVQATIREHFRKHWRDDGLEREFHDLRPDVRDKPIGHRRGEGRQWLKKAARFFADLLDKPGVKEHAECWANLVHDQLVKRGVPQEAAAFAADFHYLVRDGMLPPELSSGPSDPDAPETPADQHLGKMLQTCIRETRAEIDERDPDEWRLVGALLLTFEPEGCPFRLDLSNTLPDGNTRSIRNQAQTPAAVHRAADVIKRTAESPVQVHADLAAVVERVGGTVEPAGAASDSALILIGTLAEKANVSTKTLNRFAKKLSLPIAGVGEKDFGYTISAARTILEGMAKEGSTNTRKGASAGLVWLSQIDIKPTKNRQTDIS